MSMLQMADAFQRFLASNGMDAKGVRVIIEFDDIDKAHRTRECLSKEFERMCWTTPKYPSVKPLNEIELVGLSFSLTAKIA